MFYYSNLILMNTRPSYDEYFMEMAYVVSKRSTCIRRKVGAILVKDKHILSTGYNGAPKGHKHCSSQNPLAGPGRAVASKRD